MFKIDWGPNPVQLASAAKKQPLEKEQTCPYLKEASMTALLTARCNKEPTGMAAPELGKLDKDLALS